MTMIKKRENWLRACFHYDLVPTEWEQIGKVMKIYTSRGIFALKETKLDAKQEKMIRNIHQMAMHFMIDTVPLIPTKYGDFITSIDGIKYLLTPWIADSSSLSFEMKMEGLISQISRLHVKTIQDRELNETKIELYKEKLIKEYEFHEQFASKAEQHVYLSPFEQLYLQNFASIMSSYERLFTYLESMKQENNQDDEHEKKMVVRQAICHNKPTFNHLITQRERQFLINFEHADYDIFTFELANILMQLNHSKIDRQTLHKGLTLYLSICPLNLKEKELLVMILQCQRRYYALVKKYKEASGPSRELHFTQQWIKEALFYDCLTGACKGFQPKEEKKES
ncbi:hypothetical protein GMB86_06890 [Terrilactibacillus sp. BCM23-1]|uniref:Spore coat protein YsxE n=1 Tax=Terrilactibacillus tamarindi TaxID=2599694 RepID=A0A6N8CQ03_9BACI|nr:hypothetical protein [Terrilactibacillus tamarindi]MTT31738.1 hypothetical protein [Terrilactibacillus tamarindi]